MRQETFFAKITRYTELIFYKNYADLRAETERSYLGFLWWIFEPIMYMTVMYMMFGILLGHKTDNYVPFLLIGLTIWQWFKSCLSHGADTILGSNYIIRQVHLPKVIFPITLILTDTTKFIFIFALLLLFLWSYGLPVNASYLALPVLFIVQILFTAGLTFILAAIVPFLPDLRFVVENVLMAIFFVSGIFTSTEIIPPAYLHLYYLNPMVSLIEGFRKVLLHGQFPDWTALLIITFVSFILIAFGTFLIRRFEYIYPKVMP